MRFGHKFVSRCLSIFLFQVQVLRNAGEEVTLTVSFLKRAPAFLKLPLNEDCACKPLLLGRKDPQFDTREPLQLPKLCALRVIDSSFTNSITA